MLRLRTFGGITVERDGVPITASTQRRVLAVLALLARGGSRGVCREQIVAMLWPDGDEDSGRNALRQLLFRLRRELGAPNAVVGAAQLWLDAAVVAADVGEFEEALDAGDRDRAAAHYRGAFLDGFRVPGAPEFERWAEAERRALAARAAGAIEQLARDAARHGDDTAAVAHWRRLVALDPIGTTPVLGLTRALLAAGDATGALQQARLHERMVRQELGAEPDAAIVTLMEQALAVLHGDPSAPPVGPAPSAAASPLPESPPALESPVASGSDVAAPVMEAVDATPTAATEPALHGVDAAARHAPAPDATPTPDAAVWPDAAPVEPRSRRGRVWRWSVCAAVVGALVVSAAAAVWWDAGATARPSVAPSPQQVAVFPFAVLGADGNSALGIAAGQLLASALDGAGALRATHLLPADAAGATARGARQDARRLARRAARSGAARFVLGRVVVTDDHLLLTASLHESGGRPDDDGRVAEATVECEPAHLSAAVDALALRLLGAAAPGPSQHFARAAAEATSSLAALRAFLDAESHLRAGRYGPAVDAYRQATREDSALAIAYYREAVAADWASRGDVFTSSLAAARRFESRLAEPDRMRLRAFVAWHAGDHRTAASLYRILVTRYPGDAEAWYQLGEVQIHLAPAYGARALDARHAFAQALALQPDNREAAVHLQWLAAKAGDRAWADSLAGTLWADASGWEASLSLAVRAFAFGDTTEQVRAIGVLRQSSDETVLHAAIRTGVYAEHPAGARRIAEVLADGSRERGYRLSGSVYAALLDVALGRRTSAHAMLRAVEHEHGVSTLGARAALAALPFVPMSRPELAALRDSVLRHPVDGDARADSVAGAWPLLHAGLRPWVVGLLDVRLGDLRGALRQADALDRVPGDAGDHALARELARALRAQVAFAEGDVERALAFTASESEPPIGVGALHSLAGSRVHQRWLRAELLARLGRDEEALRWFDSIGDLSLAELAYLAPAELRQAEIHERRGDRERAAAHYRRFVALWRACDPELGPLVADAERRLARLTAH